MGENMQAKKIKYNDSEYRHQCAVTEYMRTFYPDKLFFASGNGLRLSIGPAVKFKRMGNNKGAPDLVFPEPMQGYFGLFIEMKKEQGETVRHDQKLWIGKLREKGYYAVICKGFKSAKDYIDWYFSEGKK